MEINCYISYLRVKALNMTYLNLNDYKNWTKYYFKGSEWSSIPKKKHNLKTKKEKFRNLKKWFSNMKYLNESEKMLKTYTFQYSNMFV